MGKNMNNFFVITITCLILAVSDSYGYNNSSQTFWGWRTVESTGALPVLAIGLSDSDRPCNHFLMSDRKAKTKKVGKAKPSNAATATKQPFLNHSLPITPQDRIEKDLEEFFSWDSASGPMEVVGFLMQQFLSVEKTPAHKWGPAFVADLNFEINRLNVFLSQLHFHYMVKKHANELSDLREKQRINDLLAELKFRKDGVG